MGRKIVLAGILAHVVALYLQKKILSLKEVILISIDEKYLDRMDDCPLNVISLMTVFKLSNVYFENFGILDVGVYPNASLIHLSSTLITPSSSRILLPTFTTPYLLLSA